MLAHLRASDDGGDVGHRRQIDGRVRSLEQGEKLIEHDLQHARLVGEQPPTRLQLLESNGRVFTVSARVRGSALY